MGVLVWFHRRRRRLDMSGEEGWNEDGEWATAVDGEWSADDEWYGSRTLGQQQGTYARQLGQRMDWDGISTFQRSIKGMQKPGHQPQKSQLHYYVLRVMQGYFQMAKFNIPSDDTIPRLI